VVGNSFNSNQAGIRLPEFIARLFPRHARGPTTRGVALRQWDYSDDADDDRRGAAARAADPSSDGSRLARPLPDATGRWRDRRTSQVMWIAGICCAPSGERRTTGGDSCTRTDSVCFTQLLTSTDKNNSVTCYAVSRVTRSRLAACYFAASCNTLGDKWRHFVYNSKRRHVGGVLSGNV